MLFAAHEKICFHKGSQRSKLGIFTFQRTFIKVYSIYRNVHHIPVATANGFTNAEGSCSPIMDPVVLTSVCSALSLPMIEWGPLPQTFTLKLISTTALPNFGDWITSLSLLPCPLHVALAILAYPVITDLPPDLDYQTNLANVSGFVVTSTSALHWTAHVEKNLILLPSNFTEIQINQNFRNFQLRSFISPPFNLNPQRAIYIFVGNEAILRRAMQFESVEALRYKVGIINNGHAAGEFVVAENPESVATISAERFSAFNMLRNTIVRAQLYPAKLHVIKDNKGRSIGGTSFRIMEALSSHYNFTANIVADGYQNLGQMPNGSWNGYIGNLMADRTEVVFWLGPNHKAHPYHDLTAFVLNFDVGMVAPVPEHVLSWKAILYPFSWQCWVSILISYIAIIPLFMAYYSQRQKSIENVVGMALELATRIMLQASTAPVPARWTSFVVILFSYCAWLLSAMFNSNLFAFLTLHETERVPSTLADLVSTVGRKYDVNVIQYRGTVNEAFFKYSTDPVVMQIRKRLKFTSPLRTVPALIDMAVNRSSVVIDYASSSALYIAQNLTFNRNVKPTRVGSTIMAITSYLGMRKYSKYTEAFAFAVTSLQERGHVHKWIEEAMEHSRRESIQWFSVLKRTQGNVNLYHRLAYLLENMTESLKPFSLRHFTFAFSSFAVGNFLAIFYQVVQQIWYRVRHRAQ